MEKFYSPKTLLKMAGEEMHPHTPLDPPLLLNICKAAVFQFITNPPTKGINLRITAKRQNGALILDMVQLQHQRRSMS